MIWRKSEGSKIAEYNYQCMDWAIADEECGGTFQIPGVIDKVLRDKHSGVAVSKLESTAKKVLKNEVRERVLAIIFIDNSNMRIYSELVKTLDNAHLMGQEKYPRDMATT